ncbi:hypothetical protein [Catalinimonas niigatensis]|uniref:hypothetical protein n=1 Tax=Catalinimonas niigatensis TaxID=1397264 RepID=UPI0026653785|nr:hypothetical protein [Catalinimonas niigatensis]WPP50298.1 hypothetical protein PZB72_26895 [Catalinimonas niigatensis]
MFLAVFAIASAFTLSPELLGLVLFLLLFSLHTFRNDKAFLKILPIRRYLLYCVEYHLIASPFYLQFLLHQQWIISLIAFATISLIPFVDIRLNSKRSFFTRIHFIPSEAFEWKSGIRKQGLLIAILYLIALSLYQYPYVALVGIVIFTLISTTFYNEDEPQQMVGVFQLSPRPFLFRKWKMQLLLFWTGCIPLMLIYLFANPAYWYILPVLILLSSVIQILSINLKYSFYAPGASMDKSIFIVIYVLSLFVPFFVPVPLVMMFNYQRKAVTNLKAYLDDSY